MNPWRVGLRGKGDTIHAQQLPLKGVVTAHVDHPHRPLTCAAHSHPLQPLSRRNNCLSIYPLSDCIWGLPFYYKPKFASNVFFFFSRSLNNFYKYFLWFRTPGHGFTQFLSCVCVHESPWCLWVLLRKTQATLHRAHTSTRLSAESPVWGSCLQGHLHLEVQGG